MDRLLNPLWLFWMLLVLAVLLYYLKRKKTAKFTVLTALILLFIFSVTPLPIYLIRSLEQQYPPYNTNQKNQSLPILVLGGGHTDDSGLQPIHKLSNVAISRLTEGIRIYRINSEDTAFILSGYSGEGTIAHAEVMAKTALMLGVNKKDTIMLTKPATTWEEAVAFKKRFGTGKQFVLVTSAAHMPRAIQTFKMHGVYPIAAPTNYQSKKDSNKTLYTWTPSSAKLICSERALHEYAGILYYKWFKK